MNIAFSADSSWNRWHPTYDELGQLCKKYNVKYLELVFYPENDKFYQSPEILKNYDVDICCINATAKWRPMLDDDPTESQKKLCECIELANNCNARYVIHYPGYNTSFNLKETLDQYKKIKESGNVVLKGYIDNIALELENTNLVVLPSYREGFPKVLIEASACGRAIVTTDVPGCREAVEHQNNGLLVPKENSFELAKAIRYLIENPNERRNMGLKNRKIAEDRYSINQVVNAHIRIYKEINRE